MELVAGIPDFKNYPVREVFNRPSAQPRFVDAEQRLFRTRIREGAAQGANFAGHYAAVSFGCGSNCGMMFVVDLKTGVIYKPPRAINGSMLPMASMVGPELEFRKDSALFKLKSCEDVQKQLCFRYSFHLTQNQWRLVHKLPLPPQDGRTYPPYRFEDYPAKDIYKGKPADPTFILPEVRLYATSIREQMQQGANFAGHYRVIGTACGAWPCNVVMIVDLKTGEIHKPPVGEAETGIARYILPVMFRPDASGPEFRLDSQVLRVNICDGPDCLAYSFLWNQNRWRLLHTAPL